MSNAHTKSTVVRVGIASAGSDEATRVFNEILRVLFERMDALGPMHCNRIRDLLVERLARSHLSPHALAELAGWLATGDSMSNLSLSGREMREILFLVYVDAREYYGQVAAEQLVHEATQAADRLPEAQEFPSSKLF